MTLRSLLRSPLLLLLMLAALARGEDGYRLWLRYEPVTDPALRAEYADAFAELVLSTPTGADSPTLAAARAELVAGLRGLLGREVAVRVAQSTRVIAGGPDAYALRVERDGSSRLVISANNDLGALYGAFALLRQIQTARPVAELDGLASAPRIKRRLLNHWDNLDGFVERGYAGFSIWDWPKLPEVIDPRYTDYARACASIGLNGAVLNNVNANATILTAPYLEKIAALAAVFRPYGVRVYLTARFSAPKEIGGLPTADPLDPAVRLWWKNKADEIYRHVPDFGGFLVKANSEGQPGPQDYGRTHAEGANTLADALAPHGGVVIWRAFVYSHEAPDDRAKQAYNEFTPLDGKFRANVFVQVKNGAIDFMPREPFHPLFGAMPRTPLAPELQITQEYLGGSAQLAFLAPMWRETLDADTFCAGPGSTVARVIDGSIDRHADSLIAGVANTGTDRNWTGHPLAAANWYAFGRLAWDHTLSAAAIADEWTRLTFSNSPAVVQPVTAMLLASREAVVNYSMPLGLHHIMAEGHHYGPGPWVDRAARADWTSVYYHRADARGLGFDRTASGSNAVAQYRPEVAQVFGDPARCPEKFLLWFHHVPWDRPLASGRPLWDELCLHYQSGVEQVRAWRMTWASLRGQVDDERHALVAQLLARQERDAEFWRDGCLLYFQTFAKRPLPAGVESAAHPLEYYRDFRLRFAPGDPSAR
ncbi:MAG TPA: alpha-glucuronidase family glycosyl hydrolase [Opitutaceae bacterium]|nr:alpha-glucuronidase family glycosyl hydrolase [Opitutaceae bacterium]